MPKTQANRKLKPKKILGVLCPRYEISGDRHHKTTRRYSGYHGRINIHAVRFLYDGAFHNDPPRLVWHIEIRAGSLQTGSGYCDTFKLAEKAALKRIRETADILSSFILGMDI